MEIKKHSRKNFFSKVGKGAVYTFLASALPLKLFSIKDIINKKIEIKTHPSAVKRNNKV